MKTFLIFCLIAVNCLADETPKLETATPTLKPNNKTIQPVKRKEPYKYREEKSMIGDGFSPTYQSNFHGKTNKGPITYRNQPHESFVNQKKKHKDAITKYELDIKKTTPPQKGDAGND